MTPQSSNQKKNEKYNREPVQLRRSCCTYSKDGHNIHVRV